MEICLIYTVKLETLLIFHVKKKIRETCKISLSFFYMFLSFHYNFPLMFIKLEDFLSTTFEKEDFHHNSAIFSLPFHYFLFQFNTTFFLCSVELKYLLTITLKEDKIDWKCSIFLYFSYIFLPFLPNVSLIF